MTLQHLVQSRWVLTLVAVLAGILTWLTYRSMDPLFFYVCAVFLMATGGILLATVRRRIDENMMLQAALERVDSEDGGQAETAMKVTEDEGARGNRSKLRQRAEEKLKQTNPEGVLEQNTARTLHELQVHQVELEMQNEELRHAQAELEESQRRYFDLYDLAPVGFCSLNDAGVIETANLAIETMLGLARGEANHRRFSQFIHPDDRETYTLHHQRLSETGEIRTFELRLTGLDAAPIWVRLTAAARNENDEPGYRVALSDIGVEKRAEEEQRLLQQRLQRSQKKEAQTLQARERELAEAQRIAHLGSWIWDVRSNGIRWTDEVYRIFGLDRAHWDATIDSFIGAVHPEDRVKVQAALDASFKGEPYEVDHRVLRPDGEVRIVHELGYMDLDSDGEPLRMLGTVQDITVRRRLEDELLKEKALSESILAGLPGIFYIHDAQGHLTQWNDQMEAVTGRSAEELGGMDVCALIPHEDRDRVGGAIAKTFSEGSAAIKSKLCTVEGDIPYLLNGLRVEFDGQSYLLGIGLDIANQKQLEKSLEREATTDTLTGLYNRLCFDTEMERALALHSRYCTETALVMIDVDDFKSVNDTYGHGVGDRVLVELAERLAGELREPDFLARWGGEEFVALLPETGPIEAARVAERLRRRIEIEIFPEVGPLTISLGITSFRRGDTPNKLLKCVDIALYEAKQTGRNRVVVNSEGPGS